MTSNESSIYKYTAEQINELRGCARQSQVSQLFTDDFNLRGWYKSKADPNKLLKCFPPLIIKKGFELRAYQFVEGGNGNGIVWAMPIDSPFPEPDDCPKMKGVFLNPPKPPGAVDNVMEVIIR